ncbi:hypothetical protein [Methanolapillus africanus]|uniref:hypothetical protein n=1 Tax=Methanolapillus africanus TaxID=3028297 RepID=UPI0030B8E76B
MQSAATRAKLSEAIPVLLESIGAISEQVTTVLLEPKGASCKLIKQLTVGADRNLKTENSRYKLKLKTVDTNRN